MQEPVESEQPGIARRVLARIREGLVPLLVFAAVCGACEWGSSRYYYARSYDYYHAAEVYWEEQSTLRLYLPDRYLFWTLKPGIRIVGTCAGDYVREAARDAVARWLAANEGPDACLAANDVMALGAIVGIIVMLYAYVFAHLVPHGLTFVK